MEMTETDFRFPPCQVPNGAVEIESIWQEATKEAISAEDHTSGDIPLLMEDVEKFRGETATLFRIRACRVAWQHHLHMAVEKVGLAGIGGSHG